MAFNAKFKCLSVNDFGDHKLVHLIAHPGGNVAFEYLTSIGDFHLSVKKTDEHFSLFQPNKVYTFSIEASEEINPIT